jgi:uncharacterized membrane protein
MFGWGPFPVAAGIGGCFQGEFLESSTAWIIVLVTLAASCGVLWTLGRIRDTANDDTGRSSALEPIHKEAA